MMGLGQAWSRWRPQRSANLLAAVITLALLQAPRAEAKALGVGFCADALGRGRADQVWSATLQKLRQGQRPATIPEFPCFVPGWADGGELSSRDGYDRMIRSGFVRQVLLDALKRDFNAVIRHDKQVGLQRYQNLAWGGVYLSESALLAYRRTRDPRFLDLFVDYFDQLLERRDIVLGRRDDYRGVVRQGWGSSKASPTQWINLVTHNGRIIYPATEFALLVRRDPALVRFRAKADLYTRLSLLVMDEFGPEWVALESPDADRWIMRPPTGEPEATNRLHLVGRSWINLAELTGDLKYRERVTALIELFSQGLEYRPDSSLRWSYYPVFTKKRGSSYFMAQSNGEPVWKASLTVPFLLEAYEHGYSVPRRLLEQIAATWLTVMLDEDCIRYTLDSSDQRCFNPKADHDKIGMLQTVNGILPYASVEPALAAKILDLVARNPDLFPGGWLGSAAGKIGYAYFL